jgi:uncharacterized HAD superfamily protein/adenine/guanine phosphoribosyltransferase-like PRPP-binding protein
MAGKFYDKYASEVSIWTSCSNVPLRGEEKMHYRSVADLNGTIARNIGRLPRGIDLVVGIPRSGLLAANLISLTANIPMTDLDRLVEGRVISSGATKPRRPAFGTDPAGGRRILVVDDSINTGAALAEARMRLSGIDLGGEVFFAAVYGLHDHHPEADFIFEVLPRPRMFQWNVMHHGLLERSCVDIDGVLCVDPTAAENDDGPRYEAFLTDAMPLLSATRKIGHLVTSRLEKYRKHTEAWLEKAGIEYGRLVMLDLPSMAERRAMNARGRFKGNYYRDSDAVLFIESELIQSETIARLSGKPVLCFETQLMLTPDQFSPADRLPL